MIFRQIIIIKRVVVNPTQMRKHYFLLQKLLLLLFYLESLVIMQAQHKQYFWLISGILFIFSYALEGARPYTPAFLLVLLADIFQFTLLQTLFVVLLGATMLYLGFYHIQIVGKGPYNAGYRQFKLDQGLEVGVFYPSMSDGSHCKWIPTEKYSLTLYELMHVDTTKPKFIPYKLFQFVTSFLIKIQMPVLGNASLYVNDDKKEQKWKLIMFSHGLGSNMTNFSALCGWWASHGYIVISVQHNHDKIRIQFDNRLLKELDILQKLLYNSRNTDLILRAEQLETVIDRVLVKNLLAQVFYQVNKQIQIQHIFLVGQSFGGATVLQTRANLIAKKKYENLIKGVIGLDAWFFPLSSSTYQLLRNQNILLLNSQSFFSVVPKIYFMEDKLNRIRQKNQGTLKAFVVTKTDHLSICDFAFTLGGFLKLKKDIQLQEHTIPILELHEIVISLFMEGKSSKQILEITNKEAEKNGLSKVGVVLAEQWRYQKKQK